MKKLLACIVLCFFVSVQQVSAHAEGLTPFLSINGQFPDIHPLQRETIIPTKFTVPEDLAKEAYLMNQEISFSIDTKVLEKIYPAEILQTVTYEWDLGDGAKAEGTTVTHIYTKPGSKVLTIHAAFHDTQNEVPRQLIESVQINVFPESTYTLPQIEVTANRKTIGKESHEMNLQNPIAYEAIVTNKPSAEVVSYEWDLSEGDKVSGKNIVYRYITNPIIVTPVVKATDKNGFIVYAYGILTNGKATEGYTFATNTVGAVILGVQALIVIIGIVWFTSVVRQHKKKKKH